MEYSTNKETLLSQELNSEKPRFITNLKSLIFFSLFILVILVVGSMILSSILIEKSKPKPVHVYLSGSSRYYCHLTPYPDLCYTSMSSIINTTALESSPGPIFTTSILLAINQLTTITKALSPLSTMNNPILGPRLSTCQKLVHESQSRLNESLVILDDESDMESSLDEYGARAKMARKSVGDCLLALDEKYDMVMSEDEKVRVEEVKMGVEKASKHIVNCIALLKRRKLILSDFYNPVYEADQYEYEYEYYNYYYNPFEFSVLISVYPAMYMFLALLYFLFWRGH